MLAPVLAALVGVSALAAPPVPDDLAPDTPVARCGDEVLTRGEYAAWLIEQFGVVQLKDFVGQRLILRAARDDGVFPSDAEVAAAYQTETDRIVHDFYAGDASAHEADLRRRGYEPASWAALRSSQLRVELAEAALVHHQREVDEAQVLARFADVYGRTGTSDGERVILEVLHFDMYASAAGGDEPPDPAALKAAARERAERAAAALAGGAPLSEVAPLGDPVHSDFVVDGRVDPYRRLLLGPEVERAVTRLDEPGQVSPPVGVYNGFYVVRLVERRPVTLASERAAIEAELRAAPPNSAEIIAARDRVFARYEAELLLH